MEERYGSFITFTGQVVIVCNECGVEVLRQDRHTEFHDRIDAIAEAASRARSLLGPIG